MCGFNWQKPQVIIYAKLQCSHVRHQYGIFGGKSQTSFLRNATLAGSEEGRLFSQATTLGARGFSCAFSGVGHVSIVTRAFLSRLRRSYPFPNNARKKPLVSRVVLTRIWTANLWICLPLSLPLDHESNGCNISHTCFNYQYFTPSPSHIDFNLFINTYKF